MNSYKILLKVEEGEPHTSRRNQYELYQTAAETADKAVRKVLEPEQILDHEWMVIQAEETLTATNYHHSGTFDDLYEEKEESNNSNNT